MKKMQKDKVDSTLVLLLSLAIVFSVGGVVLNYVLLSSIDVPVVSISGRLTDGTSTVNLTQAGSAGIKILDSDLSFGSGYYNSSCTTGSSVLESNTTYGLGSNKGESAVSPGCWINTTSVLSKTENHTIQNNGSVKVNVSAYSDQLDGETFFCGSSGCPFTSVAQVDLMSTNNAVGSCAFVGGSFQLTDGWETLLSPSANGTVGLCDNLDFETSNNSIRVYAKVTFPKDATAGTKTLIVTYQALAT